MSTIRPIALALVLASCPSLRAQDAGPTVLDPVPEAQPAPVPADLTRAELVACLDRVADAPQARLAAPSPQAGAYSSSTQAYSSSITTYAAPPVVVYSTPEFAYPAPVRAYALPGPRAAVQYRGSYRLRYRARQAGPLVAPAILAPPPARARVCGPGGCR